MTIQCGGVLGIAQEHNQLKTAEILEIRGKQLFLIDWHG